MKYLYQIKLTKSYNNFSYYIFADEITERNHVIANSIDFSLKNEFITSVILDNEIEYIKKFDQDGKMIKTIYKKEEEKND